MHELWEDNIKKSP